MIDQVRATDSKRLLVNLGEIPESLSIRVKENLTVILDLNYKHSAQQAGICNCRSVSRLVFARWSAKLAHQNRLVLYRPGFAVKAAGFKPAGLPRLPPGSPLLVVTTI